MKITANEIKVGMLIEYKDDLWEILKTQHVKPGKGGAFCQVEMKSINKNTKLEMKKILEEIQTGKFVRDWILECKSGQLNFKAERKIQQNKDIEKVGKNLRNMMPWITANKIVDKDKN